MQEQFTQHQDSFFQLPKNTASCVYLISQGAKKIKTNRILNCTLSCNSSSKLFIILTRLEALMLLDVLRYLFCILHLLNGIL